MNQYLVGYGGGVGPDEWHSETTVRAESLRAALDKFEGEADTPITVYSVEQVD